MPPRLTDRLRLWRKQAPEAWKKLNTEDPPPEPEPAPKPTPRRWRKHILLWAAIGGPIVGLAGILFGLWSFTQSETAAGPILTIQADGGREVSWTDKSEDGEFYASGDYFYTVTVVSNRGRSDVDLLKFEPIGDTGAEVEARVFLSEDSCTNPGRVTIPAGGAVVIVTVPDDRDAIAQSFKVLLANQSDRVELFREGDDSDPNRITTAFEAQAKEILESCAPDLT